MLAHGTGAYRQAPSGIGPLAHEWSDKPHRLVYDLASEVERLQGILDGTDWVSSPGAVEHQTCEEGRRPASSAPLSSLSSE